VFSFGLHSTLAFLLVFRVNRAADRFWVARRHWGDIVAHVRSLVSGIILHGDYDRFNRDESIRWIAAYSIATMDFIRGQTNIAFENYGGILLTQEINVLMRQKHPPTYAADEARSSLKRLFYVDANTPMSLAIARTHQMDTLENQLNTLIRCCAGMELIKTTPLPMVYVSHLRTFLILNLVLLPWVFGPSWGWATIPIVAISAFAWLGIESAAFEVERPFFPFRVNSLNMDGYNLSLLSTVQQQIQNHADNEIQQKCSKYSNPAVVNMSSIQNYMESDAEEC
jgi:ion channel-forming bestrophin family protein